MLSNGEFVYKWDGEIESEIWKETLFRYLYKQALVANVCLDGLKQAEGKVVKASLKGELLYKGLVIYVSELVWLSNSGQAAGR
ncbi:MAG: hypothetical protein V8R91_08655 [Butyricimonas faecihominis]